MSGFPRGRRLLGITLLVGLATAPVAAQTWSRTYPTGVNGSRIGLAVGPDGTVTLTGFENDNFAPGRQVVMLDLMPSGLVAGVTRLGPDDWDTPAAVVRFDDGGVALAILNDLGPGHDAPTNDFLVVRLGADGSVLWHYLFNPTGTEFGPRLIRTAGDGLILAGETHSFGPGGGDLWLTRFDAEGTILWQRTYGTVEREILREIRGTADGGAILAGWRYESDLGRDDDVLAVKLDVAGDVEWQRVFGATGAGLHDRAYGVAQLSDGSYVLGGTTVSFGGVGADWLVLHLDAAGDIVTSRRFDGARTGAPVDDVLNSVEASPTGGYVLLGGRPSTANDLDVWAMGFDAADDFTWGKLYTGSGEDFGIEARATPEGGYLFAGSSTTTAGLWLLRVDSVGGISSEDCTFVRDTFVFPQDVTIPVVATPAFSTVDVTAPFVTPSIFEEEATLSISTTCVGLPGEVSRPGAIEPLMFSDRDTLVWEDASMSGADTFALYRGDLDAVADSPTCLASGLVTPTAVDAAVPPPGSGYHYCVGGRNGAGDGALGYAGGSPRPNEAPCP